MNQTIPTHILVPVFGAAGAWKLGDTTVSCMSVCKEWREALAASPMHIASIMVECLGPEKALVRAAACTNPMLNRCDIVRHLLVTARADCLDGEALVTAARCGHEDVVQLLLGWPEHAAHADCRNGEALLAAACEGHAAVVRMLLEWPQHAARANCQNGQALVLAAGAGREDVVQLLLGWPQHAPLANCHGGIALVWAAGSGREGVVRLLLEWPRHAPRADCRDGKALVLASLKDHEAVVRLLLSHYPNWTSYALHKALGWSRSTAVQEMLQAALDARKAMKFKAKLKVKLKLKGLKL